MRQYLSAFLQMIIGNKSDLSGRLVEYDQASSFAAEVIRSFAELNETEFSITWCRAVLYFGEMKMIVTNSEGFHLWRRQQGTETMLIKLSLPWYVH